MTLIKSISGIRGTIGGPGGDGLSPVDVVKFTSAYAKIIRKSSTIKTNKIVVGRDARLSGQMVEKLVVGTLMGMGFDVVNIGLASTPTTELAVTMEGACGGIILTASHNPKQWNALKLLNEKGEFLNKEEGEEVLALAENDDYEYVEVTELKDYEVDTFNTEKYIDYVVVHANHRWNTYNWNANIDHHIDVAELEINGYTYMAIMVHRYGDVRANYTDRFIVKFDDIYDFYELESRMQYKTIMDGKYTCDIDISSEGYNVWNNETQTDDWDKFDNIGEFYEIEVTDLLEAIEERA